MFFYDLLPDGNADELSLHAGLPVLKGEKWVAPMWIWDPSRYKGTSVLCFFVGVFGGLLRSAVYGCFSRSLPSPGTSPAAARLRGTPPALLSTLSPVRNSLRFFVAILSSNTAHVRMNDNMSILPTPNPGPGTYLGKAKLPARETPRPPKRYHGEEEGDV